MDVLAIVGILLIVIGVVAAGAAISIMMYQRNFKKNAVTTVGTLCSVEPSKKGPVPVVEFRMDKKTVRHQAMFSSKEAAKKAVKLGQRLPIRYLKLNTKGKQRMDVRIVGGGKSNRETVMLACMYGAAAVLLIAGILLIVL